MNKKTDFEATMTQSGNFLWTNQGTCASCERI